jgi:hypothetical protein
VFVVPGTGAAHVAACKQAACKQKDRQRLARRALFPTKATLKIEHRPDLFPAKNIRRAAISLLNQLFVPSHRRHLHLY